MRCNNSRSSSAALATAITAPTSPTAHLVRRAEVAFTRPRPSNKNNGCHVDQKNWTIVDAVVGCHRYGPQAELVLLNNVWVLQSNLTVYFHPQPKLVSKTRQRRQGDDEIRHRHVAYHRTERHRTVAAEDKAILPEHLCRHQPRRRPTPDPSPHIRAAHRDHQLSATESQRTGARSHPGWRDH